MRIRKIHRRYSDDEDRQDLRSLARCDNINGKAEIPNGWGASDHLVVANILGRPGTPEPLSIMFLSLDGDTGEPLSPHELFVVWTLLTLDVARELEGTARGEFCHHVLETIRSAVLDERSKRKEEGD